MTAASLRRVALLISLSLILLLSTIQTSQATFRAVELRAIGHPTWKPVDCHVFSGRIGLPPGYPDFAGTLASVLPPPNHRFHPQLTIGPGDAHDPPYSSELDDGLEAADLHDGWIFRRSEFSNGSAIIVGCMVVPRPGTRGSSPDVDSGRIIPNELFPIEGNGVAYRNNEVFDAFLLVDFEVPPLTPDLEPPFDVDGHSHFPLFVASNDSFGPPGIDLRGFYRYDYTLVDTTGAGWRVQARFLVVR